MCSVFSFLFALHLADFYFLFSYLGISGRCGFDARLLGEYLVVYIIPPLLLFQCVLLFYYTAYWRDWMTMVMMAVMSVDDDTAAAGWARYWNTIGNTKIMGQDWFNHYFRLLVLKQHVRGGTDAPSEQRQRCPRFGHHHRHHQPLLCAARVS